MSYEFSLHGAPPGSGPLRDNEGREEEEGGGRGRREEEQRKHHTHGEKPRWQQNK